MAKLASLGGALDAAGGRPAGFDYMRLALAAGVIISHAPWVAQGNVGNSMIWGSPLAEVVRLILPMFFALSGFLVSGSFERSRTLGMFLGLRVIRIWPALLVEVLLSAFILGPWLTEVPLSRYFADPLFVHYFINMLGEPQYRLPGLFLHNPAPDLVNFQLWTIPFELGCYMAISALGVIGAQRKRVLAPVAAVVLTLVYIAFRLHIGQDPFPAVARPVAGPLLIVAFLVGVSVYFYRDLLPAHPLLGLGAAVLSFALLTSPAGQFLALLPIAYLTIYLGTLDPRRLSITRGADYSYGLYLYGFPIQQALVRMCGWAHDPLANSVGTLVLASVFAGLSWTYIEKPALKLRNPLRRMEDAWLARQQRGVMATPAE